MKQAQRVLSTYAVDMFGIASALFELGGLVVMHDASGCNSTYDTHDEPRWYDTPSMVYISGLNEIDTIQGNDQRLVDDIAEVTEAVRPAFIAIGGSPMPNAIGTDFRAIEKMVQERTGIFTMGFRTDGIHSYLPGAGNAYVRLAQHILKRPVKQPQRPARRVNILGLTPLEFSVVGNATTLKRLITDAGFILQSSWSMGDTLDHLAEAADADVNAVVSSTGFYLAQYMQEQYGIPYVAGIPMGKQGTADWLQALRDGDTSYLTGLTGTEMREKPQYALADLNAWKTEPVYDDRPCDVLVIGEPVYLLSMGSLLRHELGMSSVRLLCPLADAPQLLLRHVETASVEPVIREECRKARRVLADPIYARLLPDEPGKFISLPHEAYSGRHYHDEMPVIAGPDIADWLRNRLE